MASMALKRYCDRRIVNDLAKESMIVRSLSHSVAERAGIVDVSDRAGLARKVARLHPLICVRE